MGMEVRLKTGFFETTPYRLEVKNKQLYFFPTNPESGTKITIHEADILSVTLQEKSSQFEIATGSSLYRGALVSNSDWTQAIHLLKSELSVKIICEYEGGSHETVK